MAAVKTVIEISNGTKVLVQGIIGQMAVSLNWYYAPRYGRRPEQILRNIVLKNGKKSKQSLLRYLLSLYPGDGIRARRINKEPIVFEDQICENYLTNNLATNRKIPLHLCGLRYKDVIELLAELKVEKQLTGLTTEERDRAIKVLELQAHSKLRDYGFESRIPPWYL